MSESTKPTLNEAESGNKSKPLLAVVAYDMYGAQVVKGSIIDINQTVNGENLFVVLDLEKQDIRYSWDLNYKYQYDVLDLLLPNKINGNVDFEIVGNIYTLFDNYR
jgi:hypothetical protein